ncbi:MAG TPA: hypothetical protein VGM96_09695 [Reyranella sp.]|jgi:hypothetical protein
MSAQDARGPKNMTRHRVARPQQKIIGRQSFFVADENLPIELDAIS